MFLCKPSCCRPKPTFLSPRAYFFVAPSPSFFVAPSGSEGSLGTCVPRDDILGRRREGSEGCLAIVRLDKVGGLF